MLKGEVQRILERDVDLLSVAQKGQELTQGINDNKKTQITVDVSSNYLGAVIKYHFFLDKYISHD